MKELVASEVLWGSGPVVRDLQECQTTMASNVEQIAELAPEYVWGFPGTPVRIHLRLAVVARLREHLLQKSASGEASKEIGGLLLGESRPGHVEINDFHLFETDRPDRHFILSDTEKASLRKVVQTRGSTVAGYFRSDLRGAIRLSKEDLSLIQDTFRNPSHVFLVMRLEDEAMPMAGFFFWDGGSIFSEATFMQFPLDERQLEAPPAPRRPPEPEAAGVFSEIPPETPPEIKPEPKAAKPDPVKIDYGPVILSTPSLAKRKSRILWPLVSTLMIGGLAGYAAYLRFQPMPPRQGETQAPEANSSPMALSASQVDKDLTIVWNSRLPAIAGARVGMLTIRDGEAQTELPLTRAQLQINKLIYIPKSDRLEITLEVFAADGKPARESVMVVFAPASLRPRARGDTIPIPDPRMPDPKTVRTFTVRPMPPRSDPPRRPPEHPVLPEAPAQIPSSSTISKAPEFLLPPAPIRPPTSTSPAESKASDTLVTRVIPSAPVQPAKAVRQISPVLPSNVAAMLKRRTDIQVHVSVDKTGKVTKAEALATSGGINRYLGTLAANAVRLWTFQPARQGSTAIDSDLVVQITFGPAN